MLPSTCIYFLVAHLFSYLTIYLHTILFRIGHWGEIHHQLNWGWNNQDCPFFDFDFFKEPEQTIILFWNIKKTESANGPSLKIQMDVQHCFTPMLHWYDALDMPTWFWHVSSFGIEGPIIMFLAFRPAQSGVRIKYLEIFMSLWHLL
jgi:hypothetical protein